MNHAGKGAPFIGEVLDSAFSKARAVVVLLTGDDLAMLGSAFQEPDDPETERQPTPQARPNVLFEAGMAFGRVPDRTILVELGTLRPFSDIGGRHVVRLRDSVASRQELAHRLQSAGCSVVDLSGTDWHTTGDFAGPVASTSPAEFSTGWMEPTGLQASEHIILEFLRQQEDDHGDSRFPASMIANRLSLAISTTKHYLGELEEKELISASRFIGGETEYGLARKGRALLIQLEEAEGR